MYLLNVSNNFLFFFFYVLSHIREAVSFVKEYNTGLILARFLTRFAFNTTGNATQFNLIKYERIETIKLKIPSLRLSVYKKCIQKKKNFKYYKSPIRATASGVGPTYPMEERVVFRDGKINEKKNRGESLTEIE